MADVPLEPGATIDALPYLPDLLARGAAIRDLPGSPTPTVGRAAPDAAAAGPVAYAVLTDINPRPGSATLVSFNAGTDWEQTLGFRLALAETSAGAPDATPHWDPAARLLTVYLPKGQTTVVPLSSYVSVADLKLMGQWQWLREFVDLVTIFGAQPAHLLPDRPVDLIAHVLQRSVEGGHWMISPPTLLTLVHAVQQPIGRPAFAALNVLHNDPTGSSFAPAGSLARTYGPSGTDPGHRLAAPARNLVLLDGRDPNPRRQHRKGGRSRRVGGSG